MEKIVLLLNKLNDAIKQGQDAINELKNLKVDSISAGQTEEECVNAKVHELSAELYMADKVIADVKAEFKSCLKYNANTKSWDKSSYGYGIDDAKFIKPNTLDNLRGITVAVSNANDLNDTHKISCFSELNLLDRLRYIRYYYELILEGKDSDYQVFPDDPEKGYPCVPDIESNTDTKATESMGGFELFYVGYLVDRDGSIDAYSSCLEAKSKAITDNISLQSKHIEAYNQYLTFINRAAQLLNESQSEGTNNIPHGAHLALTYFCGSTMRDLLEVDGVNYIVLSYTTKDGGHDTDEEKKDTDFNYGVNHRYLLVRADENGLNALYNTEYLDDPNGGVTFNKVDNEGNKETINIKKLETITTGDLEVLFTGKQGDTSYEVTYDNGNNGKDFGFTGTMFYKRAYSFGYSEKCPIIVSSGDKKEILIWETGSLENDEKYLPKQLVIQEIVPNSVAQYDNYQNMNAWGDEADAKNRVINSWTTAFSNKSEYINTAIETINTDITSLRTKMDTIDSLCSTLRNRSFETKKTLISNLHS